MNAESLGEEWPEEKTSATEAVELRANRERRFLEDEELRSEVCDELIKVHGLDSEKVAERREGFFVHDSTVAAIGSDVSKVLSSLCENHFGTIPRMSPDS